MVLLIFEIDDELKSIPIVVLIRWLPKLEGSSKDFSNSSWSAHNIPTAGYLSVTSENLNAGIDFHPENWKKKKKKKPLCIESDDCRSEKEYLIISNLDELKNYHAMENSGKPAKTVIIEESLRYWMFGVCNNRRKELCLALEAGTTNDRRRYRLNTGGRVLFHW